MNGHNKPEHDINIAYKVSPETNTNLLGTFKSYAENEVLWIQPLELNSQHFISFVNYEWVQQAIVWH